jgi:restriction system protein
MENKNKSIFKKMMESVSKLPWLKRSQSSLSKQKKPADFSKQTTSNNSSDYFKNINSQDFEKLVYDIFKQRGYFVSDKRDGAYDGVDLILQRDDEPTYVQCNQWQKQEVDITAVGELYVAMEVDAVKYGIVITSGVFTSDALDFSLGKPLMLINGIDLFQMVEALPSSNQEQSEEMIENSEDIVEQKMPELEPLCPICSQKMIKRTAKKGKNAGNTFWGCSKFPGCRGVTSI